MSAPAAMFAATREAKHWNDMLAGLCLKCGKPGNHFEPAFRREREFYTCEAFTPEGNA